MDHRHMIIIQINTRFLIENLSVHHGIIDYLYSKFVLDDDDLEDLSDRKPRATTRALLVKLRKKGAKAYPEFLCALRECDFPLIAKKLEDTNPKDVKEDQVDAFHDDQSKLLLLQKQLIEQTKMIMSYEREKQELQHLVQSKEAQNSELREELELRLRESLGAISLGQMEHLVGSSQRRPSIPMTTNSMATSQIQSDSGSQLDDFDHMTMILAKDIIMYFVVGKDNAPPPPNHVAEVLRGLMQEMASKHEQVFVDSVRSLNIQKINGFGTFSQVLKEMNSDGHMNWGRVVTICALFGYFAREAHEDDSGDMQQLLTRDLNHYVSTHLKVWIMKQGGWEAAAVYFEASWWQTVVLPAAFWIVSRLLDP